MWSSLVTFLFNFASPFCSQQPFLRAKPHFLEPLTEFLTLSSREWSGKHVRFGGILEENAHGSTSAVIPSHQQQGQIRDLT